MAELELFCVDAFADGPFTGNPAAVCVVDELPPEELMLAIAAQNNLSETAFAAPRGDAYQLRWFTPRAEVDLCGHATLATAYVLLEELGVDAAVLRFETRSGTISVRRSGDVLALDLPARPQTKSETTPPELAAALGCAPSELWQGPYWLCVLPSEATVRELSPDFHALAQLGRCVIATAPGETEDFVSRFFAPHYGIDEDPVTGSAHCQLAPLWAERPGKSELTAAQLSKRGGRLRCRVAGDRVELTGGCRTYLRGTIRV